MLKYFELKKIISYLRSYAAVDHKPGYIIALILFTALGVYAYYGMDTFQEMRISWRRSNMLFLYFGSVYGIPLLGSYLIHSIFYRNFRFWKDPGFILVSVFAVTVFTCRSCAHLITEGMLGALSGWEHQLYWYRNFQGLIRGLLVMIPISVYWFLVHRKEQPLYGFTKKDFDLRPYFVMLLLMLPLIVIASMNADFLGQYPRAGNWGLEHFKLEVRADWKYFGLFEFIYGLDFISIEFFFRGFLVLAFARYAGPHVILPMAVFYVFIHFGKPLGETISSFFGGTLLGIISYYGRSILGGIIVHMGIAWLMEIGALVSKIDW